MVVVAGVGGGGEGAQKLKDIKSCAAVKKYNGICADKVRKSRASYENIYHSTKRLATEGLGINLCFLKRGCLALQDGEYSTAQDFLGCCAYSQFIRACNRKHEG